MSVDQPDVLAINDQEPDAPHLNPLHNLSPPMNAVKQDVVIAIPDQEPIGARGPHQPQPQNRTKCVTFWKVCVLVVGFVISGFALKFAVEQYRDTNTESTRPIHPDPTTRPRSRGSLRANARDVNTRDANSRDVNSRDVNTPDECMSLILQPIITHLPCN